MDIFGDMDPANLNDTLVGTADPDTIFGGQGDDSIDGGAGADSLDGGIGNDTITAGPTDEADTLSGGDGNDLYIVHGSSPTIIETATGGTDTIQSDADYLNLNNYANVENAALTGSGGSSEADGNALDNVLTTSALANYGYLYGGDGADSLYLNDLNGGYAYGGSGADSIAAYGADGALQQIFGDAGADTLDAEEARGSTSLYGGDDGDRLIGSGKADVLDGGSGADTITTGAGVDTISLSAPDGTVDEVTDFSVAPFGMSADRDVLDINQLIYSFTNYIYGDNPFTEANAHLQFVQEGADSVLQVRMDGTGAWQDFVRLDGVTLSDIQPENLSPNFAPFGNITSSSGGDDGDNYLQGSALPDALYGYGGADTLDGGFEADSLYGGDGNDVFIDSFGENQIFGGADNDVVYGLGDDLHDQTVYGGAGSDTFSFDNAGAGHVLIGDFAAGAGGDVLDIQSVINNLQDFDGGNPFIEGRLVFVTDGADSVLSADIFGDGTLSEVTRLQNFDWHTLTADNFAPGYSLDGHGQSFVGTPDPDSFYGSINDDTITGAASSDSLYGGDGNDSLYGGAQADTIYGGSGTDQLFGGDGNDSLNDSEGTNTLDGGLGDDTITGTGLITGDDGNDQLAGQGSLYGGIGDDVVGSLGSFGLLEGGAGNDTVVGGGTLYGGDGNDYFVTTGDVVAYGDDTTAGGSPGNDTITAYGYDGGSGTLHGGIGDDQLYGGYGDDVIYGGDIGTVAGDGNNTLSGDQGNDQLIGGAGTDVFYGGAGDDTIRGGGVPDPLHPDVAYYSGPRDQYTVVQLTGGEILVTDNRPGSPDGHDVLYGVYTLHFADADYVGTPNYGYHYAGTSGDDTISDHSSAGVTTSDGPFINTSSGDDTAFGYEGNDVVSGLAGNDVLVGDGTGGGATGNDTIYGGTEGDVIYGDNYGTDIGPGGNDSLFGGDDDDFIHGGGGNDTLYGEQGDDFLAGGDGNDLAYGGAQADTLQGGDGADTLYGDDGADVLFGGAGGDSLFGGTGDDTIDGGDGNDTITDLDGVNSVTGGAGNDYIHASGAVYGGTGDDTLVGMPTNDVIDGGDGYDTAVFSDPRGFYTIAEQADGSLLVIDNRGGTGADTLVGIEALQFSDGAYPGTTPGEVYTAGVDTDVTHTGTAFDDVITTGEGDDTVFGGTGNDRITTAGGDDSIIAGDGNDAVFAGSGHDIVDGGLGDDLLYGGDSPDSLSGSDGQDTLYGGFASDTLDGGAGNDTLTGGAGDDSIYGGDGYDTAVYFGPRSHYTITYDGTGGYFVVDNFGDGEAIGTSDHIFGVEAIQFTDQIFIPSTSNTGVAYDGGSSNDTIYGTDAGADTLRGFGGNDVIYGGSNAGGATGGGDDSLFGGTGADTIYGGAGNDTLDGGSETDSLVGGDGNDTYVVSSLLDVVVETPTGGTDTIQTDLKSVNLNTWANVENLVFTGAGNAALTGTAAANQLSGGGGNDTLDGQGGADTMTGGAGDDLYFVDNAGDVVVELPGGGTDTVKASVSTTLSANVEKLVLTASGLTGTGNDLANVVSGTAGSDTLAGGLNSVAAGDTLQGGAGDDTYVVSNANDVVQEAAGGGADTIRTGLAVYSLAAVANVENLVYTGAADFTGTGNTLANAITGGGGNDTLDGGAGADTLTGGGGNDTYYVDNAGDRVIEGAGGGNDTVYVSNSAFVLGAGQAVETLIAAGVLGVALHGNDLANHLIGNDAANLLDGGLGPDTMEGGAGSDTYIVDDAGDQVIEGVGAGSDTVKTTLSAYTLTANVEALTFTGAGNFAGTGNASDNTLVGGVGDDTLDGSTGADRLVGELGNDVYYVDNNGDVVLEQAGEGTDTVHTTLSTYVLPTNVEILHYDGAGAFNGTGNALGNAIYADAATTATLHGSGGADTLYGGTGNDSLYGEGGSDVVYGGGGDDYFRTLTGQGPDSIYGGAGTDLLTLERTDAPGQLTVDLTLPGVQQVGDGSEFSSIEQIRFAGGLVGDFARGGDLDDVLKGMGGDDTLIGGGGNDILQGGTGHDSLTGGLGADTFRFDGPVAGSDDTVTDFLSGTDRVGLSHTGFAIAGLSDFDIVTAAGGPTEAKATLIVDTVGHTISWDADGTGAGAATLLAHGAFTTNAADYLVF